jgi:hypothetical protein
METVVGCESDAMRLVDLQPKFLAIEKSNASRKEMDAFEQAQGVMFTCPKCIREQGARAHSIVCWFAGHDVSEHEIPEGERWVAIGTGYRDLTLVGIVALRGGCLWSGRIRHGRIRTL